MSSPSEEPRRKRARRPNGRSVSAVLLFVALFLGATLAVIPSPYVIETPGPVYDTLGVTEEGGEDVPLITTPEDRSYPTEGSLDMLTVSVVGSPSNLPSWVDIALAWFDRSKSIQPVEAVYPDGTSADDQQEASRIQMVNSQQEATAAALTELDFDIPRTVSVAQIVEGSPAVAVLEEGDVLTGVNGAAVVDLPQLREAIAENGTQKPAELEILRDGVAQQVSVTPVLEQGVAIIGVAIGVEYDFPFRVDIRLRDVGGPSAGLMFALGIYDKLTPGALTGGESIAGTGTIDARGAVGAIGGIRQKLYGAERAGATWFLAPAENCDEVVGHIPGGLNVVSVETLDDALEALTAIADDDETSSLPTCEAE